MYYNRELQLVQDIMDIKDWKQFTIRLYEVGTGKFITKGKAYFLKNKLYLEFTTFTIMTYNRNYNKETNTLTLKADEFPQDVFFAEIQVKNYEYEEINAIDIPNLRVLPTMEIDFSDSSTQLKLKAEGIILADCGSEVFFNIDTI